MSENHPTNYDDPIEKATLYATCLEEKQATNILGLDLRPLTSTSDTMLVATARNVRHAQALGDTLMKYASEHKHEVLGMEGYKLGQWVLVDLNDLVVHIFLQDVRGYFNLEGLWSEATEFLNIASGTGSQEEDA